MGSPVIPNTTTSSNYRNSSKVCPIEERFLKAEKLRYPAIYYGKADGVARQSCAKKSRLECIDAAKGREKQAGTERILGF